MNDFMAGATSMASFVVAILFFRFWRDTHDRFFSIFALAFVLLGVERIVLAFSWAASEHKPYVFLIRLTAFTAILIAIFDKNRAKEPLHK